MREERGPEEGLVKSGVWESCQEDARMRGVEESRIHEVEELSRVESSRVEWRMRAG